MKIPLLFILVLLPWCAFCQLQRSGIKLKPLLGVRIHNDAGEVIRSGEPPKIMTTPVIGLELSHKSFPMSLCYQKDYNLTLYNYVEEFDELFSIGKTWEENQIQVYWKLKHCSLGIGHYWKKQENFAYYYFGQPPYIRKGVQLSFVYPTKWIDIEVRTKIQYYPIFAPLGSGLYSLIFLYRIGQQDPRNDTPKFLTVNGIVGTRFFKPDVKLISVENNVSPFGIAPTLGLEFYFDKINTSFNLEKDFWLYLNGGSPFRDVRGLITNSFIGAKYHFELKNQRHLRFGLGGSWIEDFDNRRENNTKLTNGTMTPTEFIKVLNYQVKGLGVSLSYEILPNTDIEARTTIPFIGEGVFESASRTSLGIFYRFNPLRK